MPNIDAEIPDDDDNEDDIRFDGEDMMPFGESEGEL